MDPTLWLLVPGEWLHRLLNGPVVDGREPDGEIVVLLGLVVWLVGLVAAAVAWHFRAAITRHSERVAAPLQARMPALAGKADERLARVDAWSMRDVWGVVWRAEVVHLVVYVLPVLAIAAGKFVLFALFLPFSVMSFADQTGPLVRVEPLDRPACWTFVSWCPTPFARYRRVNANDDAACRLAGDCPTQRVVSRDPARAAFKLAWFALAVAWVVAWQRRRAGPRPRPAPT